METKIKELIHFSKTIKVLVVEDNKESRKQALKLLSNFFDDITEAYDGKDGLNKFNAEEFGLIITDINMPNMNGVEMITKIREINKEIPIIILSAHNDSNHFLDTIKLDISGYVLKPINITQLIETINKTIEKIKLNYELIDYKNQLEDMNQLLESQVEERTKEIIALNTEISETQKEVIFTMGAIGESRSKETSNHVKRVAEYSKLLGLLSGMSIEETELLKQASPMHDIGKVGISDAILNCPGRLNSEEFTIMKSHAQLGYDMLKSSKKSLLKLAATVAHEHHEKWDGTGYPRGISGKEISLVGRITALADVFDALGSDRVYKKAWNDDKVFTFLKEQKGKHFDPDLIELFFENLNDFLEIRDSLKETYD